MPLRLYHLGWGWALGRTFLLLVHTGRKTGDPHETVAMVLGNSEDTGEFFICSAWGPTADWLQNLHAGGARLVRVGRQTFVPDSRFLTEDEAVAVGLAFQRRHPARLRFISAILGWGDIRREDAMRAFVRGHPFVGLRPSAKLAPLETEDHR